MQTATEKRENVENSLISFDENADTDELFAWHKVQIGNNELNNFKEFDLNKQ